MNITLIGSGGHAGVVIEAINNSGEYRVVSLMDETCPGFLKHGFYVEKIDPEAHPAFCHIAIGDNLLRERFSKLPFDFRSVIHPDALILSGEVSSKGAFLAADSTICAGASVGDFTIINTGVIVEHDSVIGDFCHLAPGVVTGGRVKIGSRTFIGMGSLVRDGVSIGKNCSIGMGSVVLKDVPDNSIAWGSPCKVQKTK